MRLRNIFQKLKKSWPLLKSKDPTWCGVLFGRVGNSLRVAGAAIATIAMIVAVVVAIAVAATKGGCLATFRSCGGNTGAGQPLKELVGLGHIRLLLSMLLTTTDVVIGTITCPEKSATSSAHVPPFASSAMFRPILTRLHTQRSHILGVPKGFKSAFV